MGRAIPDINVRSKHASIVAVCLLGASLVGCARSLPIASPSTEITHIYEKNFSLNVEQAAAVGQAMVRVKDYYLERTARNAWEAKEPFEIRGLLFDRKFNAGIFPINGRKEVRGHAYDLVHLRVYDGNVFPFLVDGDGRIAMVMNNVEVAADDVSVFPATFRMSKRVDARVDSSRGFTNFELIYTGKAGGAIHISYREYSPEDLARTAFFQDLTYDAGQSAIRFRNMAIQIISATNESIVYKVLEFPEASHDALSSATGERN